jgi:hypothetical protein
LNKKAGSTFIIASKSAPYFALREKGEKSKISKGIIQENEK